MRAPCVHCGKRVGCRPRSLCDRCYGDQGIRHQYPFPDRTKKPESECYEPTQAEVDRTYAEQSAKLPTWWPEASDVDEGWDFVGGQYVRCSDIPKPPVRLVTRRRPMRL